MLQPAAAGAIISRRGLKRATLDGRRLLFSSHSRECEYTKEKVMTNTQRFTIVVTLVNLVLLVILLGHDRAAVAQSDSVLRGRSLELVDAAGQVRAEFIIEPDGEALFRMRDSAGTIRVKLGAGDSGSGLLLIDETTEPGVQIIARRSATATRPTTTSINLTGAAGQRRTITP